MLSLFVSRNVRPESESVDRDPGIVSLMSAVVRFARHGSGSVIGAVRASNQKANEAELFSSSSAWPYNHRSH